MNKILIFVVFLFTLISTTDIQAQTRILRKIQNKVESKVNQKIDRKIDQEIDKALDSIWNEDKQRYEPKEKDTRTDEEIEQDIARKSVGLFGMGNVENVKEEFKFNSKVDFEVTDSKGNQLDYSMFFTEEDPLLFGMNYSDDKGKNEMFLIFNSKDEYIVNVMEENKQYMAISLNSKLAKNYIDNYAEGEYQEMDDLEIKKTGRTKTISGYHCEEYVIINEEEGIKTESWITKDLDGKEMGFLEGFRRMAKQANRSNLPAGMMDGFLIEALVYDKKGKLDTRILVTDVAEGNFTKSLKGYQSMF